MGVAGALPLTRTIVHESYRRLLGPAWWPVEPARLRRAVEGRVVLMTGASAFDAWLRCVAPEIRADGVATTSPRTS